MVAHGRVRGEPATDGWLTGGYRLPESVDPRVAEIVQLVEQMLPGAPTRAARLLCEFEWPDDEAYSCWLHTAPPSEVARMVVATLRGSAG